MKLQFNVCKFTLNFGIAYIAGIKRVMESGARGGGGGGIFQISSDRDDERIFLGLKFSIPGFFWVVKFGKYFFWWPDLSRDFLSIQNMIVSGYPSHVILRSKYNQFCFPFWRCLRLRNSVWDFFVVNFWCRIFWGVLLEALGIFSGFDIWPHSIIPVT